ncbi:MAG: protein phosphatase 2C domain-containing protein, partial [Gemmatimonadaceae bacterium]
MKTPIETRAARIPTSAGGNDVVIECYALTDVGRTRSHNEDSFAVADLTDGLPVVFHNVDTRPVGDRGVLFMVADGMGGAAAGELASATAVEVVTRHLVEHWTPAQDREPSEFVAELEAATELANGTIFQHASTHPELRGMGTTATIAGLLGDSLYLAQVGDSRAYLVRDGVPKQLTKDQSLMQKLIEAGEISEEEALHNERRNIILQALGPEAAIKIDLTYQRLRRGDTLILCSDGLSGLVTGDEIGRVVAQDEDLQGVCERLIALANS